MTRPAAETTIGTKSFDINSTKTSIVFHLQYVLSIIKSSSNGISCNRAVDQKQNSHTIVMLEANGCARVEKRQERETERDSYTSKSMQCHSVHYTLQSLQIDCTDGQSQSSAQIICIVCVRAVPERSGREKVLGMVQRVQRNLSKRRVNRVSQSSYAVSCVVSDVSNANVPMLLIFTSVAHNSYFDRSEKLVEFYGNIHAYV